MSVNSYKLSSFNLTPGILLCTNLLFTLRKLEIFVFLEYYKSTFLECSIVNQNEVERTFKEHHTY